MAVPPLARRLIADDRFLIAVIVLVGAVLRIEAVGARLSDAEGYSYLVGAAPSAGAFLHRLASYENTPPLFYLLLTPLPLGAGEGWLRVPAVIPGVLIPLMTYAGLRRSFGGRTALLAAALVAVAPYHVSYADYSRGFMLEGLGCALALWAALELLDRDRVRWWLLYAGGAVLALYSEYDSAIVVGGIAISLAMLRRRQWLRVLALGAAPFVALAPWVPEIIRGQHALHHTKESPVFPGPSLGSLRDVTVRLVFGEHGAGSSVAARWGEFVVVVAVLAVGVAILLRAVRRDRGSPSSGGAAPRDRGSPLSGGAAPRAVLLISATTVLVLLGHVVAPAFGLDLFNERYLTPVIPLAAALVAVAVSEADRRLLWVGAGAGAALAAVAVFAQRLGAEYQPDLAPVRAAVEHIVPRELLTNSAVVAYYLRGEDPILDRPFGLGPGLESGCGRRCVVVDDARVPGGVRPGAGPSGTIGPFTIRVVVRSR